MYDNMLPEHLAKKEISYDVNSNAQGRNKDGIIIWDLLQATLTNIATILFTVFSLSARPKNVLVT